MNHRRRKAMRFEQLLWLSTQSQRELVSYLINTSLPKSGIPACISSRITTVIQVVRYHQINHNWFNEPFAVSQYKSLILRHAWLNLWDKHMTTGRINQVTWWRNQCGRSQPKPTERTTKFAVVAILKLHLNISSPIRRMKTRQWLTPEGENKDLIHYWDWWQWPTVVAFASTWSWIDS